MKLSKIVAPCLLLLAMAATTATEARALDASKSTSHAAFAHSIFQPMRLSDTDASERLTADTADYLVCLESILDTRRRVLEAIETGGYSRDERDARIVAAYEEAKAAYLPLKKAYVARLQADLSPYHVERVKDGLTHDAFPNLMAMYLEMVPDLRPAEKAHIVGLLVEARENAMLAIAARDQKQWLDKYRGIINNYIAAQGYDFGRLSKAWDAAHPHKDERGVPYRVPASS